MSKSYGHCNPMELLHKKGLSKTTPRIAVLEKLIGAAGPVTVNDLASKGMKMDRVTIYRTLNTLRENGIIREIPAASGTNYYEMACRHNPLHPHFYCTSCRSMTCMTPVPPEAVERWLAIPEEFSVQNLTISLSGRCDRCDGNDPLKDKEGKK